MRVAIEAGAEIDFATPREVGDIVRAEVSRHVPRLPQLKASGLMPSTGILVLFLGAPAIGRLWDVRHVSVSGPDPTKTVTGTALVCNGGFPSMQQILGNDPLDPFVVWTATNNIPADANFQRHECVVHHGFALYVVFSGVSANQQMACHAQVVDEIANEETVFTA